MKSTTHAIPAGFEEFAAGEEVDRFGIFARCRAQRPVFRSPTLDAWVLTSYADVRAAYMDEARLVSPKEGPGSPPYGPAMLQWRGQEHQRKGGIVAKRLRSPVAIAALDGFVRATCERLVGDLLRRDGAVDLKADYSMWIPLLVIGELMDVHEAMRFRDWYQDIAAGSVNSLGHPERREKAFTALTALGDLLAPVIERRRAEPGDDLLSDLCRVTYEGRPLSFEELRAMAAFLLTAGVETTERVLSSLLRHLLADAERWSWLDAHRELLTSVLAEALRVFPPIQASTRFSLTDVEFGGETIPAGEKILLLLASANRDEAVFDDPETFVPGRFAENAERQFTNAATILPFGAGRHHCVGSQLARLEMTHGMTHLLDAFEGGSFVDGIVPPDTGFLLRSPATVPVVLRPR